MKFKTITLNNQFCPVCGCGLVLEVRSKMVVKPGFSFFGGGPRLKMVKDYVCPKCRLYFLPDKNTGLVGVGKK